MAMILTTLSRCYFGHVSLASSQWRDLAEMISLYLELAPPAGEAALDADELFRFALPPLLQVLRRRRQRRLCRRP